MIPEIVSHYRIVRKLGGGGMGEVYLAEDTVLDRKVAIKFLAPKALGIERADTRLIREARAASKLDHPNICSIHDLGRDGDRSFIVMHYVEGETLAHKLQMGPMGLRESLSVGGQIIDALAEAHSHGIIHRDIKPQNVMLTTRDQVKVLDFGVAKIMQEPQITDEDAETESVLTGPGMIVGTAAYMSPEQARAEELDARTDIFSFGVLFYEMLTGRQPFSSGSLGATISAILTHEPPPLRHYISGAPPELERIVRRCLEKDRNQRYPSARALLLDLESIGQGLATGTGPATVRFPWRPLSPHIYLAAALVVLSIAAAAIYYASERTRPALSAASVRSIAVLPFTNASTNPDMDFLSDGITESLIDSLSHVPGLRVIGRDAVFRFKNADTPPQDAGRALNVDAVLTGRVLQQSDTLVIRTELMSAADGSHLWYNHYTRKFHDIFVVQDQISESITDKLRLKLSGGDQQRITKRYTDNAEAYALYMKGRYFSHKATPEDLQKSIEFYKQALNLDPNYALAYAGLADSYVELGTGTYNVYLPSQARLWAESAAMNALAIDDSLAEGHTSLAIIKYRYTWDWPGAEREFIRALELNPNNATAHSSYSRYLNLLGRSKESLAASRRAEEIEPSVPHYILNVARAHYFAREYDLMIGQCHKTLELDSKFWRAHYLLGLAYGQKKMYEEAVAAFKLARSLSDNHPTTVAALGFTYAMAGKKSEVGPILDDLKKQLEQQYISPENFAIIYTCLGDKDRAYTWLEKAYEERSSALPGVAQDPLFDSLRSDPRYDDLMRRIGLTS